MVIMDMDTRIRKMWYTMIFRELPHYLLCRHGRAEIAMKEELADQPVLPAIMTLSPGPTIAENVVHPLRPEVSIGYLDLVEDNWSPPKLECRFPHLHLHWLEWTQS
jgi:hypothetical protein